MNQAFVYFVFKYARLVSNTKKSILNNIKDAPSNLFALLNKSGIAWAILIYVNNKEYWEDVITKMAIKNKGQLPALFEITEAPEKTQKRGRPAADTLPVPGTGEDRIGEDPQTKIKQRSTMRKSNEIEGDGFSTRGKLFYMQVHKSLKAIRSKKWKHLWTEFWKTEGEKHIKKKKKAGRV